MGGRARTWRLSTRVGARARGFCLLALTMALCAACASQGTPRRGARARTGALSATPTLTVAPTATPSPTPTPLPTAAPAATRCPMPTIWPTATPQPTVAPLSRLPAYSAALPSAVYYIGGGGWPFAPELWRLSVPGLQAQRLYTQPPSYFAVGDLALSPRKDRLAFVACQHEPGQLYFPTQCALQVMAPDGSQLRTLLQTVEYLGGFGLLRWSPDGTKIAYTHYHLQGGAGAMQLHVMDVATGHYRLLAEDQGDFDWSPDGRRIAIASHGLSVLDVATGRQHVLYQDADAGLEEAAWGPGEAGIAFAARGVDAGLWVVDPDSGTRHELVSGDTSQPRWSPDGKKLAYLVVPGGFPTYERAPTRPWLLDVASGNSTMLLDRTAWLGDQPWSRDGRALLLAVEQVPGRTFWNSILILSDGSVGSLSLVDALQPELTW